MEADNTAHIWIRVDFEDVIIATDNEMQEMKEIEIFNYTERLFTRSNPKINMSKDPLLRPVTMDERGEYCKISYF